MKGTDSQGWTIIFFGLIIPVVLFLGWLNHIIYCFSHEAWGFLIAGAIFFPIGIFHGIYLWL